MSVWLISLVFGVAGTVVVGLLTLRARRESRGAGPRAAGGAIQLACTVCHKPLIVQPSGLVALSPPELALAVRVRPPLRGRRLAEYVCPFCEASHCFAVDARLPEWIGVNLYTPQSKGSVCLDCGKALRTPPWPSGAYDGRLREAPHLHPDYGLVCSRCQALVCVACTLDATRNRTKDGSFVCPRCFRTPVDRTYHPI